MARKRVSGVVRRIHTLKREGEDMHDFANRLGVSYVMMKQLYAGSRNAGIKTLTNVSDATGADFNWLITGKGTKYPGTELPPELPRAKTQLKVEAVLPAAKAKALRTIIDAATKDPAFYDELINFHEFYRFKARKAKKKTGAKKKK